MGKLLFWFVVVLAAWIAVRLLATRRTRDSGSTGAPPADARPSTATPEAMQQCAWCGTWSPTSSCVASDDGRQYCSTSHRSASEGARGSTAEPVTESERDRGSH